MLLVMGFTAQRTFWPQAMVDLLVDAGFFVVMHDNRDCGLSSKLDGVEVDIMAAMTALATGDASALPPVPYLLSDMSDDAFAVLDDLGIDQAHVAGASMGGMIVQTMAIEHPERVLSMASIMSTTGEHEFGAAAPEALAALLTPPPTDRAAYIDASTRSEVWSSKRYFDADETRARAAESFDRSFYPEGSPRQLAAIVASGPRNEGLSTLTVPTVVIHGADDRLITPSGGARTAELVPGSRYVLFSDMGHDLPAPVLPGIVDAVASNARRG